MKVTSDKTGLGYDFSSPNIALSSTTVFVSPADNVNSKNDDFKTKIASEKIDKGKSILRALPKVEKKETRNPRTKKVNNEKPQPKKPQFYHHCGALGHTHPNCYKWLATQQSNSMLSSRNQTYFPSSLVLLGDLLNPHVPFELERFQLFSFTSRSKVRAKKMFFQGVEGKRLKVIQSLFSLSSYGYALLVYFCFPILS